MACPDKYVKLQEEVDHYYPPGSDVVDTKWHRDMKYLDAIMYVQVSLLLAQCLDMPI